MFLHQHRSLQPFPGYPELAMPTHDRLTEKRVRIGDLTSQEIELATHLQACMQDVEVNVSLTLAEQIAVLKFAAVPVDRTVVATSLANWQEGLKTLLAEAGHDPEKLKEVKNAVARTQDVIRALEGKIEEGKTLETVLEDFQNTVLTISDKENVFVFRTMFLFSVLACVIVVAMPFFLAPFGGFVLLGAVLSLALVLTLGMLVAFEAVKDKVGFSAVHPERKDWISDKLTEFGIFGQTPKHRARSFFDDAVKNSKPSQDKLEELTQETPPAVKLMPVYIPSTTIARH